MSDAGNLPLISCSLEAMSKDESNKMQGSEGSVTRMERSEQWEIPQDLVTMNVRMERILEAQTKKVADAAVEAVQSHLKKLEQLMEDIRNRLLPREHLSGGLLPGAVEDAMPIGLETVGLRAAALQVSRSPPEDLQHMGAAQSASTAAVPWAELRSEFKSEERKEQGIQTDAEVKPMAFFHQPTIAKTKPIDPVNIQSRRPRGSRSNAPIVLADAATSYNLDPDQLGRCRRQALLAVRHSYFEVLVMLTLLASSATLGIETHLNMQDVESDPHVIFRIFDIFWCAAFLLELFVRMLADGGHFLNSRNPEFMWNLTDTVLVAFSTADEVVFMLGFAIELSQFRLLRMVRLVRVLHLLRVVRFCSDLRIMVNGIAGSVKTLFWAMLLLGIVIFIFGVTFMQLAYNHLRTNPDSSDIMIYYGTLGRSMLTLFMAISGGIDWKDAVAPLSTLSEIIDYLMGVYVFFTVFCLINVVTGIFVDNAKALGEQEMLHQRAGQYLRRRRWVKEVVKLFAKMDISAEGDLSYEEFAAEIQDERVQECFRHLGINVENHTADELFELFDVDEDGKIDPHSFEQAIRQFHGAARSIDVYKLRRDTQKISKQLYALSHALADQHGHYELPPHNNLLE